MLASDLLFLLLALAASHFRVIQIHLNPGLRSIDLMDFIVLLELYYLRLHLSQPLLLWNQLSHRKILPFTL